MPIQTTRWKPDTCDCVIEYDWDDSMESDKREHALKSINKCAFHNKLDDITAFETVMPENVLKNNAVIEVLASLPVLKVEDVKFLYDSDRLLTLTIEGINALDKTVAQDAVDIKVGMGNVVVE